MYVGLAGDWHKHLPSARLACEALVDNGATRIYQLGDLGVWPGPSGVQFLDGLEALCIELDVEIWAVPGNHDDYDQIWDVPVSDDGLQWIRPHVALIPRGHRWEQGGRTFVGLGGAPSIDYMGRVAGVDWWPNGELITPEEVKKTVEGGFADVMLAHDAPADSTLKVRHILATNPMGWSLTELAYAAAGRKMMDQAWEGVRPSIFAHGHYHVADDTEEFRNGTRFLALDCNGRRGCLALLNLDTLEPVWF